MGEGRFDSAEEVLIALRLNFSIKTVECYPTTVLDTTFEGQPAWLQAHHYRIAPLRSVLKELTGAAPVAPGALSLQPPACFLGPHGRIGAWALRQSTSA